MNTAVNGLVMVLFLVYVSAVYGAFLFDKSSTVSRISGTLVCLKSVFKGKGRRTAEDPCC